MYIHFCLLICFPAAAAVFAPDDHGAHLRGLGQMEIGSQAEWDEVATEGARVGSELLIRRALAVLWKHPAFAEGPIEGGEDVKPHIPWLHPKCARLIGLALEGGHEAVVEAVYTHHRCIKWGVQRTAAMLGTVLVEAAEAGSAVLTKRLLGMRVPDEPGQRTFLRRCANEALLAACKQGNAAIVDLLVGDWRYRDFGGGVVELALLPLGLPSLEHLGTVSRNWLAEEKYSIEGGQGEEDAPMLVSLITGDMAALKELLAHDGIRPTPSMLLMAAHHGHFGMIEWIRKTYPDVLAKMTEGVWGVLLLEAAEHDHVGTVEWIFMACPAIKAGVREALRIALEHKNVPIQRMLMPKAHFQDDNGDWRDMRVLLGRAITAGNAEGLEMLLGSEYVRHTPAWQLEGLGLLKDVQSGDVEIGVVRVLLASSVLSSSRAILLFSERSLPEQKELLPLVSIPGFVLRAARMAITLNRLDTLEWLLLGQFGESVGVEGSKDLLTSAYMVRNADATRVVLMCLLVDPGVRDEFCERAMVEDIDELIPLLCGVAFKGAGK